MLLSYRAALRNCLLTTRFESQKMLISSTRTLSVITSTSNLSKIPNGSNIIKLKIQPHVLSRESFSRSSFPRDGKRKLTTLRPYVDPKVSYAYGRSSDHFIYSTVSHEFDRKFQESPDEICYISYAENIEASFRKLYQDVNRLVKGMAKKFNIVKGDFVGIFAYNCYNWLVIQLACARIGAVVSPINPSYKSRELAFVLKKGKIKCLFMPGPKSVQFELNDHLSVLQADDIITMSESKESHLRNIVLMDEENEYNVTKGATSSDFTIGLKLSNCNMHNWNSITENDGVIYKSSTEAEESGASEADACVLHPDLVSPDDLFAVYYTSGTTGNPKGACVSHFTALNNARFCTKRMKASRPENWRNIVCVVLPMFHIYAGVLINFVPMVSNGQVIYPSHKYVVKDFVDSIYKYNVITTALTPTMIIDLLSYIEANKLKDFPLKVMQSGGAYVAPETVSRTFKTLPALEEFRVGYGSTENGSIATLQNIYEPSEMRAITVGSPIDMSELRIVKPNTDELVPHGVRGEIQTRGHNTMVEYLDEPGKTAEVLTQTRWYKTGDLGILHPHGSLQICGRLKSLIIKGGENIYPEEISNLIQCLDYVERVHVVGVPDKRFGEQVCAWVKLKAGYKEATDENFREISKNEVHRNDIINYCKENITYFKVPKYVLFVEDFPMTPTKKVQSHIMTEMSIEMLGLDIQKA